MRLFNYVKKHFAVHEAHSLTEYWQFHGKKFRFADHRASPVNGLPDFGFSDDPDDAALAAACIAALCPVELGDADEEDMALYNLISRRWPEALEKGRSMHVTELLDKRAAEERRGALRRETAAKREAYETECRAIDLSHHLATLNAIVHNHSREGMPSLRVSTAGVVGWDTADGQYQTLHIFGRLHLDAWLIQHGKTLDQRNDLLIDATAATAHFPSP